MVRLTGSKTMISLQASNGPIREDEIHLVFFKKDGTGVVEMKLYYVGVVNVEVTTSDGDVTVIVYLKDGIFLPVLDIPEAKAAVAMVTSATDRETARWLEIESNRRREEEIFSSGVRQGKNDGYKAAYEAWTAEKPTIIRQAQLEGMYKGWRIGVLDGVLVGFSAGYYQGRERVWKWWAKPEPVTFLIPMPDFTTLLI